MRQRLIAVMLLAAAGSITVDVHACGDKFLSPNRGARIGLRPAERANARVVLLAPAGSTLDGLLRSLRVQDGLRKAGYAPALVTTTDALAQALSPDAIGVVVSDAGDAAGAAAATAGAPRTAVLPVVAAAPARAAKDAKAAYGSVLRDPRSARAFVEAIDSVVLNRARVRVDAKSGTH